MTEHDQELVPGEKVMSLQVAIESLVRPGDVILAGYTEARPNAALMQVARSFAGKPADLTLVTAGMVSVQHSLVELGVVTKVIASFIGENYPSARPSPSFQRALADGRVTVENWSMWALIARYVAGALGISHFPVRSMIGTGMAEEQRGKAFAEFPNPFGSGTVGAVAALRPDVTLLHAVAADRDGNLLLSAPYGEASWGALAAKRGVIATVEKIVDSSEIKRNNALVRVPGHLVNAVCLAPFGSHPYGVFNPGIDDVQHYVDDDAFMKEVFTASKTPETFAAWIDEWILGVDSHDEYVAKLGSARRAELVGAASDGHPEAPAPWTGPATPVERQVVTASRRIRRRVEDAGFQTILAGVGLANLASWISVDEIKATGGSVELMAEIGMYGYTPQAGDPFIFSHRNLPTSTLLTDVMTVLGGFVSGPATRTIGVLGAGEVDQSANVNSTYSKDGAYIVGSGGANDIASGAEEVLLTVAHNRLVDKVGYITSPGANVHSIVSSRGVFERRGDDFVLVSYIVTDGEDLERAVAVMRAESDWKFGIADDVYAEDEPTHEEIALLRSFDPNRVFLKAPRA